MKQSKTQNIDLPDLLSDMSNLTALMKIWLQEIIMKRKKYVYNLLLVTAQFSPQVKKNKTFLKAHRINDS